MALYDYFLTHPYGPVPRSLEWIYLDRVGGQLIDLDSENTFPAPTDGTLIRIVALANTTIEIWQLIASTHVSDPPNGWVRPLDFQLSVNEKVWKRLLSFGVGGGTIPPVTNVLKGDGAGNAADSGVAISDIVLKNPTYPTPNNENDIVALLQAAGLCA